MIHPIRKTVFVAALTCLTAITSRGNAQNPTRLPDAKVYDFGGRPVIEHGDTLKLVYKPGEIEKLVKRMQVEEKVASPHPVPPGLDTLVILLKEDSAFVVLSGKRFPMHPRLAEHFRQLRFVARRDAEHPIGLPIIVH
jgi:hypothetical protein